MLTIDHLCLQVLIHPPFPRGRGRPCRYSIEGISNDVFLITGGVFTGDPQWIQRAVVSGENGDRLLNDHLLRPAGVRNLHRDCGQYRFVPADFQREVFRLHCPVLNRIQQARTAPVLPGTRLITRSPVEASRATGVSHLPGLRPPSYQHRPPCRKRASEPRKRFPLTARPVGLRSTHSCVLVPVSRASRHELSGPSFGSDRLRPLAAVGSLRPLVMGTDGNPTDHIVFGRCVPELLRGGPLSAVGAVEMTLLLRYR